MELQERSRTFEGTHLWSYCVSIGTIAGRAYDAFGASNMIGMKFNWNRITYLDLIDEDVVVMFFLSGICISCGRLGGNNLSEGYAHTSVFEIIQIAWRKPSAGKMLNLTRMNSFPTLLILVS